LPSLVQQTGGLEGPEFSMRHPLRLVLAVVIIAGCARQEPPPEPVRAVRTMTLGSDVAGAVHEYAAEVRARTEARLGFRVGGKMVSREVDLGDMVKKGAVLARLDPQDLKLGQDAAGAALRAAQSNFDLAASEFKRFEGLRAEGFISAAELERRDASLKAARAQLAQARAQSGVQGNQTAYAQLVAEADGVVTAVEAEPGAVLAAGTPVLRLAHDGPRDVVFSVPEDRLPGVRALIDQADAVQVSLWGNDGKTWPASVREVSAAADPATRTFLVKADIGAAPVRLGQTATARIAQPALPGVIKLPLSAVLEQQGKTSVWLLDKASMTVQPQPIEVGGADGNSVVVSGGLAPGQTVVTAGVHVLTPGLRVKLYAEPTAAAASGAPQR
jgi:membrane fusion protein, multidrug efflux system